MVTGVYHLKLAGGFYIYRGLRGFGAFGPHPPGPRPKTFILLANSLQIYKLNKYTATWMELCQTSDHIYIYKGLRGSRLFGTTLRGCIRKTVTLSPKMLQIHKQSQFMANA